MEDWDPADRRPMIVFGKTTKGYWPAAVDGKIPGFGDQIGGLPEPSRIAHEDEFAIISSRWRETFEERYGVEFAGIRQGAGDRSARALIQFKTNIDVVMSVLDRNGLGDWLADRLVAIGDTVKDDFPLRIDVDARPVPRRPSARGQSSRRAAKGDRAAIPFRAPKSRWRSRSSASPARWPARAAAISEIIKWMNYVTGNRFFTVAADLSESINVEHGSLWGHYDPETNPLGTRLKAAIQEAGNVSTAIGLVSQSASVDPDQVRRSVGAERHLRRVYAADVHAGARLEPAESGQRFRMGVLHILAAHSGPETAADARTHFGIFSPQVWKLFPRGQAINLNFWDYNDVAAGYFAAAEIAARDPKVGIITIEVARPDFPVADRSKFADTDLKAAAKGLYVIRDFAPGKPRHGYVMVQGSSSTFNLVRELTHLEEAGINVKVIAAVSEELFDRQPEEYRHSVLPPEAYYDLMVVSTGTRRMWPLRNVGPLTDEYSLTSDWDNQWLTGGLERT